MKRSKNATDEVAKDSSGQWTARWLDSVVSGKSNMSQRKVSSIDRCGGGLAVVRKLAKQRGIHLVRLTDDRGNDLVAASKKPFKVIC